MTRTLGPAGLVCAVLLAGAARAGESGPYPPTLPDGRQVLTFDVDGVTVDFMYYPGQDYRGNPWSNWGDGLAVGEKYYSAIGDHIGPAGNAFVHEYDAATRTLRKIVDLRAVLRLPDGHYTPGKIHSRIDIGSDGWLYFGTHRGSTRVTVDKYHYRGDWILRHHPASGRTEVVAHGPAGKQCLPSSVFDPERLIFYGGTQAGDIRDKRNLFFAYDCRARELLHKSENGPSRALILAPSTGKVYFVPGVHGRLHRYDPAKPGQPPVPVSRQEVGLRAATAETPDGYVYFVSKGDAVISRFNVRTETIETVGTAPVGTQSYITTIDADPTGGYLYYCPGAHGGSERDGTPIVRLDTRTGRKSVVVRLHPAIQKRTGFVPIGTFGSAISPSGDKLYFTWNGSIKPVRRGKHSFDLCALTVIHLPGPDAPPTGVPAGNEAAVRLMFRDMADASGLRPHVRGMMAHAAGWADVNGDGALDLFVGTFADRPDAEYIAGGATGPVPNRLLLQREGRFTLSDQPALAWRGRASGVVLADLDNDGDPDLYVSNNGRMGHRNLLYRNDGTGRFADVTDAAGAPLHEPEFGRGATTFDHDGDGLLDLLVLSTPGKGRSMLFRNLGGMRFEISDAIPGDAFGLGAAVADITGNGWPDVFIGGTNRLFVGQGDGMYREARELALDWGFERKGFGEGNAPSCGAAFGDIDGDGRLDLVIGSHFKRPWVEPNALRVFRNLGSTPERVRFREITDAIGLAKVPMKLPHVEVRDFDNDGRPDLYSAYVTYADGRVHPGIFRNLGPGPDGLPRFAETAFVHRADFPAPEDKARGGTREFYDALVANQKTTYMAPGPSADYDGDGRLDLFLAAWFPKSPSHLLRNETKAGNWLAVKVVGRGGVNRDGIGAVVRAYETGRAGDGRALVAMEAIATSYGYTSAQPPIAHLGLGGRPVVDLVITLPHSKGTITRRGVKANQLMSHEIGTR